MANQVFTPAKQDILTANLDLGTVQLAAMLIDSASYVVNQAHQYVSDIPAAAVVASANILNAAVADGSVTADNVLLDNVPAGPACEAIVIYENTGVDATSRLVTYIDTGTGLPVTPDGTDLVVTFPSRVVMAL